VVCRAFDGFPSPETFTGPICYVRFTSTPAGLRRAVIGLAWATPITSGSSFPDAITLEIRARWRDRALSIVAAARRAAFRGDLTGGVLAINSGLLSRGHRAPEPQPEAPSYMGAPDR
jgi:hypothetical protein